MYSGYHGYISLSLLSSNMSNSYYYLGNRDMIMRSSSLWLGKCTE